MKNARFILNSAQLVTASMLAAALWHLKPPTPTSEILRISARDQAQMAVVGHCRVGDPLAAMQARLAGAQSVRYRYGAGHQIVEAFAVWSAKGHKFEGQFRGGRLISASEQIETLDLRRNAASITFEMITRDNPGIPSTETKVEQIVGNGHEFLEGTSD